MALLSRRAFTKSAACLLGGAALGLSFRGRMIKPLLSFSTLGCPDWPFSKILDFAVAHGYSGIEIRGLQHQLDLTQCPEFNSAGARKQSLQHIKDKGLSVVDLGSSATLHFAEGEERRKNIEEGKRFIDLAHDLECAYVRVFPNKFIEGQSKEKTIALISSGLLELAAYAKGSAVKVLIESHGDLVHISDIETVMKNASHDQVGMIWDIANAWTATKETPAAFYAALHPYIFHTHVKDAVIKNGELRYTLLGRGEVPFADALMMLAKGNYKGYYSFEWEKLWHPEIEEPETAIADYPLVMESIFKQL